MPSITSTPAPVQPHRVSTVIVDSITAATKPVISKTIGASVGLFAARCLVPSIVNGVTFSSVLLFAAIDSALKLALKATSTWFYHDVVTRCLGHSDFLHLWKDETFNLTTELGAAAITATVLGMPVSSMLACAIIYELLTELLRRAPNQLSERQRDFPTQSPLSA